MEEEEGLMAYTGPNHQRVIYMLSLYLLQVLYSQCFYHTLQNNKESWEGRWSIWCRRHRFTCDVALFYFLALCRLCYWKDTQPECTEIHRDRRWKRKWIQIYRWPKEPTASVLDDLGIDSVNNYIIANTFRSLWAQSSTSQKQWTSDWKEQNKTIISAKPLHGHNHCCCI